MSKVLVFQHIDIEHLGRIGNALDRQSLEYEYVHLYAGQEIPSDLSNVSGVVLMGGPMGVYEEHKHKFLLPEMKFIEKAIGQQIPMLGVCLGSQLIAKVLGSRVKPGGFKEIGWYPVQLSNDASKDRVFADSPREFDAFLWHGDIFDCPADSVNLASTEQTECQAFRYADSVHGLLFHLESTEAMIQSMTQRFKDEMDACGIRSDSIQDNINVRLEKMHAIGDRIFDHWTSLITKKMEV